MARSQVANGFSSRKTPNAHIRKVGLVGRVDLCGSGRPNGAYRQRRAPRRPGRSVEQPQRTNRILIAVPERAWRGACVRARDIEPVQLSRPIFQALPSRTTVMVLDAFDLSEPTPWTISVAPVGVLVSLTTFTCDRAPNVLIISKLKRTARLTPIMLTPTRRLARRDLSTLDRCVIALFQKDTLHAEISSRTVRYASEIEHCCLSGLGTCYAH